MNENTIILTFPDADTANYVRLVCSRKSITLEDYIIDNFEWDDKLPCRTYYVPFPTVETCEGCDYSDKCPDVVAPRQPSAHKRRQP